MKPTKRQRDEAKDIEAGLPLDWPDRVMEILYEEAAKEGLVTAWPEDGSGEPLPYLRCAAL